MLCPGLLIASIANASSDFGREIGLGVKCSHVRINRMSAIWLEMPGVTTQMPWDFAQLVAGVNLLVGQTST